VSILLFVSAVFDFCELVNEVICIRVCFERDLTLVLVFVNTYAFTVTIGADVLVLLLGFIVAPKTNISRHRRCELKTTGVLAVSYVRITIRYQDR
jgi:hypothetical protein